MTNENRNASRRLTRVFSWELVALVLLISAVVCVAERAPVKSFPSTASSQKQNDPYDLHAERTVVVSSNRVETGL